MIISHKHRFIFLKTHKTAGTSIEIALSKICGELDSITPISPIDDQKRKALSFRSNQNTKIPAKYYEFKDVNHLFFNQKKKHFQRHMNAKSIKNNVSSKIWDEYFKFTIERNPYDRITSLFYWRGGFEKFDSVAHFLNTTRKYGLLTNDKYMIDGKLAIDKVYQYENLEFMMQDLTKRFNLNEPLKLPTYRAKSSTREEEDYRKVLDDKSIKWIQKYYKDIFERFNYKL
ncbi:MAG: hypothetical protein ACJARP_000500 [Vicingaceae bacterium]|jgi:hypothetical protein